MNKSDTQSEELDQLDQQVKSRISITLDRDILWELKDECQRLGKHFTPSELIEKLLVEHFKAIGRR